MAKILQNCTIISFIVIAISLLPSGSCDLIDTTCNDTPYPGVCSSFLRGIPEAKDANLSGLTVIMISSLTKKSNDEITKIDQLLKTKPGDEHLTSCKTHYKSVIDFTRDATNHARNSASEAGQGTVVDILLEIRDCEDGFHPEPSPLTDLNQTNRDVSNVIYFMFGQMRK
ncbi:OLC1v1006011C1 [Oldenlandia corymbosa var. corymbosa]|uniref:OLC1v1006011C1 n=1 Tax=Oldenlandia corymbosa var. corymbosa TaxID=529605 RepID=A0AAV1DFY2_OLDCO|nr:OLC1v1006011C1 [Oldenlandia corymbosa var. corymbosa]